MYTYIERERDICIYISIYIRMYVQMYLIQNKCFSVVLDLEDRTCGEDGRHALVGDVFAVAQVQRR